MKVLQNLQIYIYTSDTTCLFFLEKSLKNGFLLYTKRPMFSCQKQSAETSFSFVNLTWKNLKRHLFTTAYCQRNKKISEMKRSSRQLETKTDKVATSPEDYLLYKWMNKNSSFWKQENLHEEILGFRHLWKKKSALAVDGVVTSLKDYLNILRVSTFFSDITVL